MTIDVIDAFLCHNSKDKPLVMKIAKALKNYGVNPWIDKNDIHAGEKFLKAIQKVIPKTKSGIIFFGLNGVGPWQEEEIYALQVQEVNRRILLIPILLPGVEKIPDDYSFLQSYHYLSLTSEEITEKFLDDLVEGINGQKQFQKTDEIIKPSKVNINDLVQTVRYSLSEKTIEQLGEIYTNYIIRRPIELDKMYVNVNILNEPRNLQTKVDTVDIDNFQQISRLVLDEQEEKILGIKAVEKYKKLFVLGKPGSGKTTFLQHIAIQCIKGELLPDLVPIFIEFDAFNSESDPGNYSLMSFIRSTLQESTEMEIQELLKTGKILLLLDALDELPEVNYKKIEKDINSFISDFYKNHLVITSRTQATKYLFRKFTYVEIADFSREQVEDFAQRWFRVFSPGNNERQYDFVDKLFSKGNSQICELAVTPLLLNLICKIFNEDGEIPSNTSSLYELALSILLKEWDDSKEIQPRNIQLNSVYKDLSLEKKEKLLSYIAAHNFEQEEYRLLKKTDIEKYYIPNFLKNLNLSEVDISLENIQAVLQAIELQHGLLVERAKGLYSFSHLTFQEYLTAKYFTEGNFENKDYKTLASHIHEKHWRDVILLASEMIKSTEDAEILLDLMKEKVDNIVSDNNDIINFIKHIKTKVDSISFNAPKASIRSFYLALKMNFDFELCLSFEADLMKVLLFDNFSNLLTDVMEIPLVQIFSNALGIDFSAYINTDNLSDEDAKIALESIESVEEIISSIDKDLTDKIKIAINIKNRISPNDQKDLFCELAEIMKIVRYLVLADFQKENLKIYGTYLCSNIARKLTFNPKLSLVVDFLIINLREIIGVLEPDRDLSNLNPDIIPALKNIKKFLPTNKVNRKDFEEWWEKEGIGWTEALKIAIGEDRENNVFSETHLTHDQKEQIKQYYQANIVLKLFLNKCHKVSRSKRDQIEDALLIPI